MKIAYLANIRFPSKRAHSVQIFHMCNALSSENAEVTLFANKRSQDLLSEVENVHNTKVKFKLERISHGLFYYQFKLSFYLSELYFAARFFLTGKQNTFDYIYSRHEWIIWFLSIFLSKKKLVWESHEAKLNFPARRLLKKGVKTVTISEGIFEDYVKYGIPNQQMIVAHDGIDDSFFEVVETKEIARKRLGLSPDERIVMYLGGFEEWKGVETLFAASNLYQSGNIVAVGGNAEQVTHFSKKYPKVTFLGSLPYADLKHNQQAADILIIPNSGKTELSSRYTSPLKLFAHMASAIPVIASDIPSLTTVTGRELVTLVPPDDEEALATAIEDVFMHYDHKKNLAQELKVISVKYTWNKRAKDIIDFILKPI